MMSLNADDGSLRCVDGDGDGGGGGDGVDVSLTVPFAVALAVDDPIWTVNKIHYYFLSVAVVVYHLFSLFFVPQFLYFYFHENSLTTALGPPTWNVVRGHLEGR